MQRRVAGGERQSAAPAGVGQIRTESGRERLVRAFRDLPNERITEQGIRSMAGAALVIEDSSPASSRARLELASSFGDVETELGRRGEQDLIADLAELF